MTTALSPAATFRALHRAHGPGDPLVLPGAWDAGSAQIFAAAGSPALATPSHGVSLSLGHEDGSCPADEMFPAIARIVRSVDIPVSADIERGYGLPPAEVAARLLDTGAVGCNLEDTLDGALVDIGRQADFLAAVRAALGPEPFLNARVDTFLHGDGDPVAAALERARAYLEAGADGIYPILAPPEALATLAAELEAPLNSLSDPAGPHPPHATRITFGGTLAVSTYTTTEKLATTLAGG